MKLKDGSNRIFCGDNFNVHACDVDEEGDIENIDIIVDGKLKYCINIQHTSATADQYREALALLFDCLTK